MKKAVMLQRLLLPTTVIGGRLRRRRRSFPPVATFCAVAQTAWRSHIRRWGTHSGVQRKAWTAVLLAALLPVPSVRAVGTDYLSDASLTVSVAGGSEAKNAHGAVGYDYRIGRYEVTNAQYAAFLNAVAKTDTYSLYSTGMADATYGGIARSGQEGSYSYTVVAGRGDWAVNYVSFYDTARFANWLTNGGKAGAQDATTTESGLYVFGGAASITLMADHTGGSGWAVASEDEWYRAAFYNPDNGSYYTYAGTNGPLTQSDANYFADGGDNIGHPVAAGSYALASFAGTYDQNGNVAERSDTFFDPRYADSFAVWGGSFNNTVYHLSAEARGLGTPGYEGNNIGFRVVKLEAVPEPATCAALISAAMLGAVFLCRRRKHAAGRGALKQTPS